MLGFFECKFEFKKGNIQIVARSLYVDIPTLPWKQHLEKFL